MLMRTMNTISSVVKTMEIFTCVMAQVCLVNSHGANDSAGILGNVTTYKVDNAERAQNFTIRILDCVNGPGVKLYSASMGAGIFGYLSCDNASVDAIQKSTCKVKI